MADRPTRQRTAETIDSGSRFWENDMEQRSQYGRMICAGLVLIAASLPCGAQQWSGYVPASDGVQMATDVYFPVGIGPWPVVLTRTPYNKQDPGHYDVWCQTLAQHGYACVVQDCRGRFASAGTDTIFRDASRDGHTTLEWIADQEWCNGSIASVGGSAMGITGYAMAPGAPPELKCMVAGLATPDIYSHIFSYGGSVRWELAYNWLAGQGSLDIFNEFLDHRLRDAWWNDYNWLSPAVNVKTLHFGGWWDLYIQGPIDAYREYQDHGGDAAAGNQYMVMGPWHHFTLDAGWLAQTFPPDRVTGELRFPDNAFPGSWPFAGDSWQLLLAWLGNCLRDETTEAASWPHVRVYLMGAIDEQGAPGNRWIDLDNWPPNGTMVPYYLTTQNLLSPTLQNPGQLTLEIDPGDPVPTLGGANHFGEIEVDGRPMGIGPYDQRVVEERDDVLTFTTPVLDEPVTIMGRVSCRLWVRPDTPDLDLSVRLTDVYPDGRSMHVLDGVQRARMRCGDDRECFLEPGVATEIEVDLWTTAIVFNAGHKIRVAVAGSNWPRFEVNPNDGGDLRTGTPIVARPALLFGEEHPSAIELPVVPSPRRPGGRVSRESAMNTVDTIIIGNQSWMAENLQTTFSASGDPLNGVFAYDDDEDNVEEYGRLYTWESALSACPDGWHLPTNAEWDELITALGSNAADQLKSGGTSGFEAKMGGRRSESSYGYLGDLGLHWTSTEAGDHATQKVIVVNEPNVITDNTPKSGGLSVRCLKD